MKNIFCLAFWIISLSAYSQVPQTDDNNISLSSNPDSVIYTLLPVMPKFGMDDDAVFKFFKENSKYPMSLSRKEDTKAVYVSVVIEKNGDVTANKIRRQYNEELGREAIRLLSIMPKWEPGKLNNGLPARMVMTLPFWFK